MNSSAKRQAGYKEEQEAFRNEKKKKNLKPEPKCAGLWGEEGGKRLHRQK